MEKWKERKKIMDRRTNELEWGNALYKVLADDNLFYFFLEINNFFIKYPFKSTCKYFWRKI